MHLGLIMLARLVLSLIFVFILSGILFDEFSKKKSAVYFLLLIIIVLSGTESSTILEVKEQEKVAEVKLTVVPIGEKKMIFGNIGNNKITMQEEDYNGQESVTVIYSEAGKFSGVYVPFSYRIVNE